MNSTIIDIGSRSVRDHLSYVAKVVRLQRSINSNSTLNPTPSRILTNPATAHTHPPIVVLTSQTV